MTVQALQRDSTSPGHRDVELPKDLVFELELEEKLATRVFLEHPVLGEWETPFRYEDVEIIEQPEGAGE